MKCCLFVFGIPHDAGIVLGININENTAQLLPLDLPAKMSVRHVTVKVLVKSDI